MEKRVGFSAIGNFGVAGLAFVALIELVTLSPKTSAALTAANFFAVALPCAVAAYFVAEYRRYFENKFLVCLLKVISVLLFLTGQATGLIGLFYIFEHIDPSAARIFGSLVFGFYTVGCLLALFVKWRCV